MNSTVIRLVVLTCTFGGALLGMLLRGMLPERHLSADSKDTVTQASSMAIYLGKLRWLMLEQGSTSISLPLLVMLVFWLAIVFTSFGLFAPGNVTVIGTLFLCALSVSSAIFLILAMYTPFQGVMQISSAPLRNALAHLGQ